jgi:uncharacterized protein YukE
MGTIRLRKLVLTNFQGGTFEFSPGGKDANVYARNGVGKTRLFSAFTWLLFGKDSLNRSDFAIKNLNDQGQVEDHDLQHTVEGIFDVDGVSVTLKKIYAEKFVKNRGKIEAEFAGHTTQHFVNDVPKAEKDYKAYIQEIAGDENLFRLLSSPTAFPMLPWQKQRALLLEIFGDVSDADIISSDPQLARLPEILGKHTVEDYKKIVAAKQSKINESLGTNNRPGTIRTRIDEVRRGIPDVTGLDRNEIKVAVERLESEVNAAKLRLQGVDTGGAIAGLSKQLAGINADLQKMEQTHYSETMKTVNKLSAQISETENLIASNQRKIASIGGELKLKEVRLKAVDEEMSALRATWAGIDAEEFQYSTEETCRACGQSLTPERVQENLEKALAAFNTYKAERLTAINARGLHSREESDRLLGEIDALEKEREILEVAIPDMQKYSLTLTEERDIANKQSTIYERLPDHVALLLRKSEIESSIEAEKSGKVGDRQTIQADVDAAEKILKVAKDNSDKFVRRETGEERIEELKAEEKRVATEAESLAADLYLIDLFTRRKVDMLSEKMTGQFEIVSFKMGELQVNGSVNDQMCELMVNGIGYNSGLNSAARTNGGMDIIRTMQRHYALSVPVFIDNAESVVELLPMECQLVRLVVSESDTTLRVEVAA